MATGWQDLGSIEAIAAAVRAGELDPVDLTERALLAAGQTASLNAVVHLDAEGARAVAARHDRAGALAGVPVLVKEIIEVQGLPDRCGSRAFEDRIGHRDAAVVRRLRESGAVIIGLSHSHEFAYGCTGTSNRAGPCRNPHDPDRITGGSSGGAGAAVAGGVVPLALGTDTAGSVRIPAALCGVVGAKPARGTLPVDGVYPLAQSLDHVGVLTATVADGQYAVTVLAGPVGEGSMWAVRTPAAPQVRLGLVTNPEHLDYSAEVGHAWHAAVESLRAAGVELVPVRLPDWSRLTRAAIDLQGPEAVANHAGRSTDAYQADVRRRLREAAQVPPQRYAQARAEAGRITAELADLLRTVDAILLPTVPIVAPPLDAVEVAGPSGPTPVRERLLRNTRLTNVTGHPSLSLPLPATGPSSGPPGPRVPPIGLPVGVQLVAADNEHLWRTAKIVENLAGIRR